MTDSTNPTPDAVALAFREMADADPETELRGQGMTGLSACCGSSHAPEFDNDGIPPSTRFTHYPDCPWLRRNQARERAEKALRDREAVIEKLLLAAIRFMEENDRVVEDAPVVVAMARRQFPTLLAALKGAPTK